jgi:hypothetical protein
MICEYIVPKYVPLLRFHTLFSIDVVQYAVTKRTRYTECPQNMRQNFGIRSHVPKGTKYFIWTCVLEFFNSAIMRPPRHTSRNVNFHNHNLSAEENLSGIVLSFHQHLSWHLSVFDEVVPPTVIYALTIWSVPLTIRHTMYLQHDLCYLLQPRISLFTAWLRLIHTLLVG